MMYWLDLALAALKVFSVTLAVGFAFGLGFARAWVLVTFIYRERDDG